MKTSHMRSAINIIFSSPHDFSPVVARGLTILITGVLSMIVIVCAWAIEPDLKGSAIQKEFQFIDDLDTLKNPFVSQLPAPKPKVVEAAPVVKSINPDILKSTQNVIDVQKPIPVPPKMTITGLVWSTPLPQVIINNKVYAQGEIVDGLKIVKIFNSGIIVTLGETSVTVASNFNKIQ